MAVMGGSGEKTWDPMVTGHSIATSAKSHGGKATMTMVDVGIGVQG